MPNSRVYIITDKNHMEYRDAVSTGFAGLFFAELPQ